MTLASGETAFCNKSATFLDNSFRFSCFKDELGDIEFIFLIVAKICSYSDGCSWGEASFESTTSEFSCSTSTATFSVSTSAAKIFTRKNNKIMRKFLFINIFRGSVVGVFAHESARQIKSNPMSCHLDAVFFC